MQIVIPTNWAGVFMTLFMIVPWVMGIAIAKGFWMTVGAICLPPMAWVLVAQWLISS